MDFLWRRVSEKEKKEIEANAKKIMEDFSKRLSKIDEELKESNVEGDSGEREEKKMIFCDENFSKKIMFQNAKEKSKDFIIAEKKSW